MTKVRTWVGLDVHAAKVVACVVDAESGEMSVQRLPGRRARWWRSALALPGPVRVAYEAGPTGFGLARALQAAGIGCVVAAPGKIERPAQDRVKTDRRDAERLVRLLMIGGLHPVRVPSARGGGAARPGPGARGPPRRSDARAAPAEQAAVAPRRPLRGQHERPGRERHRPGCRRSSSASGARRRRCSTTSARSTRSIIRRDTLEADDRRAGPGSPWAERIARLRCLRGIDTLSAVGLCAEIDDFARFEHPGQLMSYLGLVPSEHSTGQTRRQGAITKTGSRHARRLLVEAAWHYRRPPRIGTTLERRQTGPAGRR